MANEKTIAALAATEEERMLLVRVCDRIERAERREQPVSTFFLTPRERTLAAQLLPQAKFFGGTEGAERTVAYYLPEYLAPEDWLADGVVACLRATFYEKNALTHRDMLGALMGAGLRRDAIGDIYVAEDHCDFFVLDELAQYLLDNLTSAGRTALKLRRLPLCEVERPPERLRELRVTVSSLRLDGVLSAAFHVSRADAAQAVNAGRVAVNGAVCVKPDRLLAPQDVLALRGKGKLRLLSLGGETKKGRQALTVGIYE